MSSTNKTPNIGLNSWIPTDRPEMNDFNADNTIIDTKIKSLIDSTTTLTNNSNLIKTVLTSTAINLVAGARTTWDFNISTYGFKSVYYAIAQVAPNNVDIRFVADQTKFTTTTITFIIDNLSSTTYNGGVYPFIMIVGK